MTGYDPQRNRARAQPAADETAPVDMLLGGETPTQPDAAPEPHSASGDSASSESVPSESVPSHAAHEHGPDCDHDHDLGGDPRVLVAAAGASALAVVMGLRRWRRRSRRRSGE